MTLAFLSVPTPHQVHLFKYKNSSPTSPYPSKLVLPLCSPSSSTSTPVIEEDPSSSSSSSSSSSTSADELPIPDQSNYASGCKACGREEIERGCNGEGRIQGGIATVPGFGWWPIKAYRPCPEFLASGGRYRRQGQSMDEVAFGRGPTSSAAGDSKPSKKKQSPKKV